MFVDYNQHSHARHSGSDYHHIASQAPHMNQASEVSVLQGVLDDFDMAMFAGDYAKKYQENLAKWENCTMAEWEAHGAGEQTVAILSHYHAQRLLVLNQKFVDLIDMVSRGVFGTCSVPLTSSPQVKDHMQCVNYVRAYRIGC